MTIPNPANYDDVDDFIFVDCETTGLSRHQYILELSYAIGNAEPVMLYPDAPPGVLEFRLRNAEPKALEVNKWLDRYPLIGEQPRSTWKAWGTFFNAARGKVLVGANPRFDTEFITREYFGYDEPEPWHHRLFDIQAYAAGVFGWTKLKSFAAVVEELTELGFELPKPDHTAKGDVIATRAAWAALRSIVTEA